MADRSPPLVALSDIAYLLYGIVPTSWLILMARIHGRVLYLVRRRSAKAIRSNLAWVLNYKGDTRSAAAAARRFFEWQQVRVLLLHLSQRMDVEEMKEMFPVSGLEQLDEAIADGQGAILLLSHLNSLGGFLAVILLRRMGYDVRVAIPMDGDPWAPSRLRRALDWLRGEAPESILESLGAFYCQFNIRPIISALREKAIVAQTGDGWHSAGFVDVEFLGNLLPFTTGVMSIARSTGTAVVPLFTVGAPPEIRFVLEESFAISTPEELNESVAHYAARMEAYVIENPESWQHWEIENTIATMASWRDRSLSDKYRV